MTQTGCCPVWYNLHLLDAIRAHDKALPHEFNQVLMPDWIKSWYMHQNNEDAALIMGLMAFCVVTMKNGVLWKVIHDQHKMMEHLEKKLTKLEEELEG